jgi:biopolymer transport protein ExbD
LAKRLKSLASDPNALPTVVIGADGRTPHQSVVAVMEAARIAGLHKITFMSQAPGGKK